MDQKQKQIKCVIWDLDNTVWDGVLSEGGGAHLLPGVEETIRTLDERGIVNSIASKNDYETAMRRLKDFGLEELFLCPQISWNPKSVSVGRIQTLLNIKPEATAFVDDSAFERDEVQFASPLTRVYPADEAGMLADRPEFQVRFVTEDAANRRKMYQADLQRQEAEEQFTGNNDEFLSTLHMKMDLAPVTEQDLQRAEELTIRTHQLNSTGYTYSYEELLELSRSKNYIFRICGLTDDYGTSGKVGLLLLEEKEEVLLLKLLIVSCRVMTRGIGSALLCYATQLAERKGKRLQAEFFETEYNRIMYVTYKFAGFEEVQEEGREILLEYQGEEALPFPDYLQVTEEPQISQ